MDSEVIEGRRIHTDMQAHTKYNCTIVTTSLHAEKEQEKANTEVFLYFFSFLNHERKENATKLRKILYSLYTTAIWQQGTY